MALLKKFRARACTEMLVLVGVLGVIFGPSCRRSPHWVFEAEPRTPLAVLGITAAQDPKIEISPSGMISMLVVYPEGSKNSLGFTVSHDGGDRFSPLVPITGTRGNIPTHGENAPTFARTPSAIYTLWAESKGEGEQDLALARSLDFGRSFETSARVNDNTTPSFRGYASIATGPQGDIYVVWLDGREHPETPDTFDLYFARSLDNGKTFGPNTRIARSACPCCRPRIVIGAHGEIYIAWRKVFPGQVRDIVLSLSKDRGESFAAANRISVDGWVLNGCPDSGPALAENNGHLYVAWLTAGSDDRARIRLARSDDGGTHFDLVQDASHGVVEPNHPMLAVAETGQVLLCYQGRQPSRDGRRWNPYTVFVSEIHGDKIADPVPIAKSLATSTFPVIAIGPGGNAIVAWNGTSDKETTIYLARAIPSR